MWFGGGSFIADGCEVGNNDDDLSDVFTYMGYTCANAGSESSIYVQCGFGIGWLPGDTLRFYDCKTLELIGEAKLTTLECSEDKPAFEAGPLTSA